MTHEGPWQPEGLALLIGDDVTVGHGAILHACRVGDRCLIGKGAIERHETTVFQYRLFWGTILIFLAGVWFVFYTRRI